MPSEKVASLDGFIRRIRNIRQKWKVPDHKELWFRGEGEKYDTFLRPKLYRPARKIEELLDIENWLYEYFQRCGAQLCDTTPPEDEQYWDWYFLMQHHGAPTRLLDWTDGALIALHIALRDKAQNDSKDAFV